MANVVKPNTFTNNTAALASEVNDNFDTIYDDYNGNIDSSNLATNAVVSASITDASVITAKINDGAVTPAKLTSGTGSSWSYQSWSPSYSNITVGNGTVTAKYVQMGKTVFFRFTFVLGGTSAIGTGPTISLPVTSVSYPGTAVRMPIGEGTHFDTSSGNSYPARARWASTTTMTTIHFDGSSPEGYASDTSTSPFTWATGDEIHLQGFYEAA